MKAMPVSYHRFLDGLSRQEERFIKREPLSVPMGDWEKKVPAAARDALDRAFLKAFALLFGPNGTKIVEHTYSREKRLEEAGVWERGLSPGRARGELRRMERRSRAGRTANRLVSGAEGTVLGLLGIGLPDIPVLLAHLLRDLYQTALRYGFDYRTEEERTYLLLLIQCALEEGEQRREKDRRVTELGRALDHGWPVDCALEREIERTAAVLSERLLLVKFIQGIPLVGVVGGAANLSVYGQVSRYAQLKYKRRFLEKKVRGL